MAVIEMNSELFYETMKKEGVVLVDFSAPWCSYCQKISSAFDEIGEEYKDRLTAAKVNIDDEEKLSDDEHIDLIPTLVIYKNGKNIGSVVAPESKAAIEAFISETLAKA